MTKQLQSFSLIGPGKVGSSLAMALTEDGWICKSVVQKIDARVHKVKLRRAFPHATIIAQMSSIPDDFDVLLIAVRDDEIQKVVARLSIIKQINWSSKIVLHASGVKSVGILSPLKNLGAVTGALHPVAAFASQYQPGAAIGIYYDFFGDEGALQAARQITKLLKSKLIVLKSEEQRILLHIASAIASNSTVVAVRSAEKLISSFIASSDAKALMEGLLASTVKNLSINNGMKSLTGPLARADLDVISEHIKTLKNDKALLQFYKSWSLLGMELLLKNKPDRNERPRDQQTALTKIKRLLESK
jgi:predicted short-subunit dehydrogenase-like oxidoreductase (DUF2520 family)